MKITEMNIKHHIKRFAENEFNIQYLIDNEQASEEGVKLNHKDFKRLIDLEEFIIPEDAATTFQGAIEWYFKKNT